MYICHDLKKESAPVSPPLPASFRVIPILFFAALAGCAFFIAYYMLQLNQAQKQRMAHEAVTMDEKKKMAQITTQQTQLDADLAKAKSMIEWVNGSRMVQPIAIKIASALEPGNIVELQLQRKVENPWQLDLNLRLNGDGSQVETVTEKLRDEKYRPYRPQRTAGAETTDYRATLIYQKSTTAS